MKSFIIGSKLYGLTNKMSDTDTLNLVLNESEKVTGDDNNEYWTLEEFKEKLFSYNLKALEVYYEYMINVDAFYKLYNNEHEPFDDIKNILPDFKKESLSEFEIIYYNMIKDLQYDGLVDLHSNGNHKMFKLDLQKLRNSVSAVCSNSYVKAKKKIKQGDEYVGLKSYYHVIRILIMFTYLAKHGDFKPSNFKNELEYVYQDIVCQYNNLSNVYTFESLDEKYSKMIKSLQHTFRLYCPKEIKN